IIVTELPYQVNKAKLIERIADHVRDKRIEGISDLRDESDRNGMRIVIELRRDANARSEEHTSELQSRFDLVCRLLLEKKKYILTPTCYYNSLRLPRSTLFPYTTLFRSNYCY